MQRFMRLRVVVVALLLALTSCTSSPPVATAHKIKSRAELIGGPRALGEVGDWLIENDKVRFIVQDAGFSRGFGVFGGALLDADLVRKQGVGNSEGGTGQDNFGEMFPAFFLEALEPREVTDPNDPSKKLPPIEIENDGSDGKAAVLVVRGNGGDFIALTQKINELLLGDSRLQPTLFFETRYVLEPGANFLKITTRVQNIAVPGRALNFPNAVLPGGSIVPTPFGDVVLFGAGNNVFAPHKAGYDIRFTLEDIYASNSVALPALPGIAAEFVASSGKNVSYGILAEAPTAPTQNFVNANASQFPGATDHSLHIPFIASAFTGVFQVLPPPQLAANDSAPGGADEMQFTRYFMVGDGDVASISDTVHGLLGVKTGSVAGRVRTDGSGAAVEDVSIVVENADTGDKVTQMSTDAGGRFDATLRPGTYDFVLVKDGYASKRVEGVVITEGKTTREELTLPQPAQVTVVVVEEGKGRVPAKISLVGTTPAEHIGEPSADWLYDLGIGEHFRYTDLVDDDASDPSTLRYIEHFDYSADGTLTMTARPGDYTLVVSRGIEYDRVEIPVSLKAGATANVTATLKRTVDTTGYVGADFHLHSVYSLDSNASLKDRITSYAGEGVEYAVSTDHNFIVDYRATIEKAGLSRFINSAVGLELTTIDRGHFNGFPLQRGSGVLGADDEGEVDTIASRTYGSFEWALRNPEDIFTDLRKLGRKKAGSDEVEDIILQVNHPRDSILGYFDQYGVNAESLAVEGQSGLIAPDPVVHPEFNKEVFSFNFDAIEVFNGKRFELLRTFVVPEGVTRDPASCCPLAAGEVFREYPEPNTNDAGIAALCTDAVDPALCNCVPSNCEASADAEAFCDALQAAQIAANKCVASGTPVAFPGVRDDWLRILATGRRVVGTANSDSHEPEKEEPGSPRTYIRVPSDDPAQVSPDDVVAAFKSGDVLMTNGPFVQITANGVGMGGTATGTSVELKVHVEQTSWVKADTLRIFKGPNAEPETYPIAHPVDDITITLDVASDTFIVAEVLSTDPSSSLFPSIYPNEVPPLQFTDVIGSLGSSLGLATLEGALQPALTFVTTPYALTNPIYIDADGNGWQPSSAIPELDAQTAGRPRSTLALTRPVVTVPTEEEAEREAIQAAWAEVPMRKKITLSHLPRWLWPSDDPRDIRRVLVQFVRHAH